MKIKSVTARTKLSEQNGNIKYKNYPNVNPAASGAGITFAMRALNKLSDDTLLNTEVITIADAPVSIVNEDANASITFPEDTAVEFINYANNCTVDAASNDTSPEHSKIIFNEGEVVVVNTANTPDYVCNTGNRCTITTGFGSDTIINDGDQVSINAVGRIGNDTSDPDDFIAGTNKHIENSGEKCTVEAAADIVYFQNSGNGNQNEAIQENVRLQYFLPVTLEGNDVTIKNSGNCVLIYAQSAKVTNSGNYFCLKKTEGSSAVSTVNNSGDNVTLDAVSELIDTGNGTKANLTFDGNAESITGNYTLSGTGANVAAFKGNILINGQGNHVTTSGYSAVTVDAPPNEINGNNSVTFGSSDTVIFNSDKNSAEASIYLSNSTNTAIITVNGNYCTVTASNWTAGAGNIAAYNQDNADVTSSGNFNVFTGCRNITSTGKNNIIALYKTSKKWGGKEYVDVLYHHFGYGTFNGSKSNAENLSNVHFFNISNSDYLVFGEQSDGSISLTLLKSDSEYHFIKVTGTSTGAASVAGSNTAYVEGVIAVPASMTAIKWRYFDESTFTTFSLT